MASVFFSIRSKGLSKYLKRGRAIVSNYGLTPSKMTRALDQFAHVLQDFGCGATFPITAIAVKRNAKSIEKYVAQGIEFAVHGYRHIDHSQLTLQEQISQLHQAQDVFKAAGIPVTGFRSPYLRFNNHLRKAASEIGLAYVSNQPVLWDVLDIETFSPAAQAAYQRAIKLYSPWLADRQPALPILYDQLVEIPVSLPDDEILLDRLESNGANLVETAWSRILDETYRRQELFTVQLHPERTSRCAAALAGLLARARSLDPPVWVARLEEIAGWWRARSQAAVTVTNVGNGDLHLSLEGPEGIHLLVRNVEVDGPTREWIDGYQCCEVPTVLLKTGIRPFIGVPVGTSQEVIDYLRQQDYIVETSRDPVNHSIYLDEPDDILEDKRALLDRIETSGQPLVKLGRWPNQARSALSITGDVDALTIWDYGLRFVGY
ncbi:MAG: hypothetical protein Kow0063_16910 [Anaerolineae bacterium]